MGKEVFENSTLQRERALPVIFHTSSFPVTFLTYFKLDVVWLEMSARNILRHVSAIWFNLAEWRCKKWTTNKLIDKPPGYILNAMAAT